MARSNNWRINKSNLMAVEGAMILRALQKVAGVVGLPKDYTVKFATRGKSPGIDFENKELVIGAGQLFQEAPMPAEKFDVLVGLDIHGVRHWKIDTDSLWNTLEWRTQSWDKTEQSLFQRFVNIGEDIVIETDMLSNPNLSDYDKAVYDHFVEEMGGARLNKLLELWIEYALGHKTEPLPNLPQEMVEPMQQLVALTAWLRRVPSQYDRVKSYLDYWHEVKDVILHPPQLESIQLLELSDSGADDETDKGELDAPFSANREDAISEELEREIETAFQAGMEDITKQVYAELGNPPHQLPVISSRETRTPLIKPNSELRRRLEQIMNIRKRLQSRVMHGEQYGKLDKRHLHRVRTDERVFSLTYKFPDGFPNCRILIDLSGSMDGQEADEALEAAAALQTLVGAEVWCYNKTESRVNLVRMDEGKLVHKFEPEGNTPSGLAIVGVSLGMKRDGLVIHLTDGDHNVEQPPWDAHCALEKRGVNLVNLIWGESTEQYELDDMNYRKLEGLAEFPGALYQILVEQTKLSRIISTRHNIYSATQSANP